jgi:hypothetical protein
VRAGQLDRLAAEQRRGGQQARQQRATSRQARAMPPTGVITTGPYAYRRPDGIAVIPAVLLGH